MRCAVLLTAGAERDLADIRGQSEANGSPLEDGVLDKLLDAIRRLADHPQGPSHPRELASLGIKAYRQFMVRHYRVIYGFDAAERRAIVYVVADSRRDFQPMLTRRLLAA